MACAGVTQRAQRTGAYITTAGTPSAQSGSAMRAPHAQGSTTNYAHAQLPLFQPMPESQPVLPCLLRRLLQQVRSSLARHHARRACKHSEVSSRPCPVYECILRACRAALQKPPRWQGGTATRPTSRGPWSGCFSPPWSSTQTTCPRPRRPPRMAPRRSAPPSGRGEAQLQGLSFSRRLPSFAASHR